MLLARTTHAGSPEAPPVGPCRPYRRPFSPALWWLARPAYVRYILRESTSLFVSAYALFLLVLAGADAELFDALLTNPIGILLHLPVLAMVLHHTATWFNLTPQVVVVRYRGKRIPPQLISAAHYAAWLAVSLAVWWVVRTLAKG